MAFGKAQHTVTVGYGRYAVEAQRAGRLPSDVAREVAWLYFRDRYRAQYKPTRCGLGQVHGPLADGKFYHGRPNDREHEFVVEFDEQLATGGEEDIVDGEHAELASSAKADVVNMFA